MTNKNTNYISEERLVEIVQGTYIGFDEGAAIAAKLIAANAQLHADDQRAWEALGKPEGTYDTTNVQRLCAEVERLRCRVGWLDHLDTAEGRAMHASEVLRVESEQLCADLRCALRLLRQAWSKGVGDASWARETFSLMELHKEPNQ